MEYIIVVKKYNLRTIILLRNGSITSSRVFSLLGERGQGLRSRQSLLLEI